MSFLYKIFSSHHSNNFSRVDRGEGFSDLYSTFSKNNDSSTDEKQTSEQQKVTKYKVAQGELFKTKRETLNQSHKLLTQIEEAKPKKAYLDAMDTTEDAQISERIKTNQLSHPNEAIYILANKKNSWFLCSIESNQLRKTALNTIKDLKEQKLPMRTIKSFIETDKTNLEKTKTAITSYLNNNILLKQFKLEQQELLQKLQKQDSSLITNINKEIESACRDSITLDTMCHPVTIHQTGQTYEYKGIKKWLETSKKCPLTGILLSNPVLIPNHKLKQLILIYKQEEKQLKEQKKRHRKSI